MCGGVCVWGRGGEGSLGWEGCFWEGGGAFIYILIFPLYSDSISDFATAKGRIGCCMGCLYL